MGKGEAEQIAFELVSGRDSTPVPVRCLECGWIGEAIPIEDDLGIRYDPPACPRGHDRLVGRG